MEVVGFNLIFDLLFYLLIIVSAVSILFFFINKGWLNRLTKLSALNEILPWIFIIWFLLGISNCMEAASNIGGMGSTKTSKPLITGILIGPILFIISLFVRNHFRKSFQRKNVYKSKAIEDNVQKIGSKKI